MGDLNQAQTKRIVVTDINGVELGVTDFTVTTDDPTIANAVLRADQAEYDLIPVAAGNITVSVTGEGPHVGQTGSSAFVIDPAFLTVTLADPLPTA